MSNIGALNRMINMYQANYPSEVLTASAKAIFANEILNRTERINDASMSSNLVSLGLDHDVSEMPNIIDELKYNLYEKKLRLLDEKVEPDIEYYKEFYIWARHYIHKLEDLQSRMVRSVIDKVDEEWEESQQYRYEQARQEAEMAAQEQRERWENNLADDIGYGRGVRPDKSSRSGFSDGWQKK